MRMISYLCSQLFLTAGIDLVPSSSSCFQREGPGAKLDSSANRLVENSCQSTTRTKTILFLICLNKLTQMQQVIVISFFCFGKKPAG